MPRRFGRLLHTLSVPKTEALYSHVPPGATPAFYGSALLYLVLADALALIGRLYPPN